MRRRRLEEHEDEDDHNPPTRTAPQWRRPPIPPTPAHANAGPQGVVVILRDWTLLARKTLYLQRCRLRPPNRDEEQEEDGEIVVK